MSVRRMAALEGDTVVSYVHNAATDGMGKIGVLVAMTGGDEALWQTGCDAHRCCEPGVCPKLTLDPAWVAKEKSVQIDIARESGKPDAVIEKMIVGRMAKFMAESTLLGPSVRCEPGSHS